MEKYRPNSLSDLISHEGYHRHYRQVDGVRSLAALLFYGPPGTGRRQRYWRVPSKCMGKNLNSMVLQLNASDDRGIDIVRNQIKTFAGTEETFQLRDKVDLILDEPDHMTNDAQFALRRVMEKYSKTTRFCMICNYVSKIIPALQSRCTKFRFAPLSIDQMKVRAQHVISSENIHVTEDGLATVLRLARGDMRKVLNVLQATSMAHDTVNEENVCSSTGSPLSSDIKKCIDWLMNATVKDCFENIRNLQYEKRTGIDRYCSRNIAMDNKVENTTLKFSASCWIKYPTCSIDWRSRPAKLCNWGLLLVCLGVPWTPWRRWVPRLNCHEVRFINYL